MPHVSHLPQPDAEPENRQGDIRAVCKVLYGDQELAAYATTGEAMAQPVASFPCGARIVKGGVIKAKLTHAVSEKGNVYAGWMLCAEKERAAR